MMRPNRIRKTALVFDLNPGRDYTLSELRQPLGDPRAWDFTWKIHPLPEPVHLKAGQQYQAGFDKSGQPFVRARMHGSQEVPE